MLNITQKKKETNPYKVNSKVYYVQKYTHISAYQLFLHGAYNEHTMMQGNSWGFLLIGDKVTNEMLNVVD